jgi:predicted glycosyltransferase
MRVILAYLYGKKLFSFQVICILNKQQTANVFFIIYLVKVSNLQKIIQYFNCRLIMIRTHTTYHLYISHVLIYFIGIYFVSYGFKHGRHYIF